MLDSDSVRHSFSIERSLIRIFVILYCRYIFVHIQKSSAWNALSFFTRAQALSHIDSDAMFFYEVFVRNEENFDKNLRINRLKITWDSSRSNIY